MRTLTLAASLAALVLAAPSPPAPSGAEKPLALPDPLVMRDGTPVTTRADWSGKRRPELKALFEREMYGKAPAAPDKVAATVDREDRKALGGKATLKEVTLAFGPPDTPKIQLLLLVPNARKGPAPTFLGLNFHGNHTALNDPKVALPTAWVPDSPVAKDHHATDAGRGFQASAWNAEEVLDRGYGLALMYGGDVAPDHPGHADGVHPHYPGSDWGTVAAWAWGLSRAADYLVTDPDVDKSRLAVIGHSRMGKAALLAGAFDDRFALVFAHQAGCGGSAPSRGTVGESVKRINTVFPHWFNAAFKGYNDDPSRLPFDQNALVALAAPRPVLLTNAVDDTWANPEGQFQVLQAAEPVYKLLGAGGLGVSQMPEVGKLAAGTLGFAIRPGKHAMTPEDWVFFLDFADTHFGRKPTR